MNLASLLGASEDEITDATKRMQFLRKADPGTMCERSYQVVGEEVSVYHYPTPGKC